MSFTELQQAIYDEAQKRADEIDAQYRQKLASEEGRIKKQAQLIEEEIIDQARYEAKQKARFLHQEEKLLSRAQVLKVKQEEIEKVKKEVKSQIINWEDEKVDKLIKGLVELIPENVEGEVVPGSAHEKWVKKYTDKKKLSLSDKQIQDEGGLIYRGKDVEINVTVGRLVDQLFSRRRSEVAKALFA
jgi:V/A-type H+-transporting ATPase subunit E